MYTYDTHDSVIKIIIINKLYKYNLYFLENNVSNSNIY